MRRIRILAKHLSRIDIQKITQLLKEAGFASDEIEVIAAVGDPLADCDDELVFILLTDGVCADPSLEQELVKMQTGGRRAICVWPQGADPSAEPPIAAHKYGYSIIAWDVPKLCSVAGDEDVPRFERPDGERLPDVHMQRNLCVEEEAKRT